MLSEHNLTYQAFLSLIAIQVFVFFFFCCIVLFANHLNPCLFFFFFFLTLNLSHVLDLSMLNCLYCIRGDSVGQEAGMHPYWDARQ